MGYQVYKINNENHLLSGINISNACDLIAVSYIFRYSKIHYFNSFLRKTNCCINRILIKLLEHGQHVFPYSIENKSAVSLLDHWFGIKPYTK